MTLTERDRKILVVLVFLGMVGGFWYLFYKPKSAEVEKLDGKVAAARSDLDSAEQRLATYTAARTSYASNYRQVVQLGKAIPDANDRDAAMVSLLVQLDTLAGKKVEFVKIAVEEYPQPVLAPSFGESGGGAQGAGGPTAEPVASGSKGGGQSAGGSGAGGSGGTESGGNQSGGGSSSAAGASSQDALGALSAQPIPIRLQFQGSFFKLHEQFAAIRRLVHLSRKTGGLKINGRVVFAQGFTIRQGAKGFPQVAISLGAIVFSLPSGQSVTAGSTPAAPSQNGVERVLDKASSAAATAGASTPSATATPAAP